MSHRYNKRIDTNSNLDVLLYHYGKPVATGIIKNLSINGAFIETEYPLDADIRYIEFTFDFDSDNDLSKPRVRALVIHHTQQGFGLMTNDSESLTTLMSRAQ